MSRRRLENGFFCRVLCLLFAGVSFQSTLAAENTSETVLTEEIHFRRVFVPADSPEVWPVGSEQYLPIPRSEFERLVKQKQSSAMGGQRRSTSIRQVVYRAELSPKDTLRGEADFQVELFDKPPQLLPLQPLNLALQSASWSQTPLQPAAIGLWKQPTGSLQQSVLVEQPDTLQLKWELTARRNDAKRLDFYLQTPLVAPQRLELLLPAEYSATLSTGELLETKLVSQPSQQQKKRRWVFQLATRELHRLQVHRETEPQADEQLPLVSQATSYQLKPTGLKMVSRLRIDARELELTELRVKLAERLQVVDVTLDQQPVAWRLIEAIDGATLVVSRPDVAQLQTVEIRCLAKLPLNIDTAWQLPQLQLLDAAWTEGTVSLHVSPELELHTLAPSEATLQHIVGITDETQNGEVFRFQLWSEKARIEIAAGRPATDLSVLTATTVELGRDEAEASVIATLSNAKHDVYQIQAIVEPGWTINSVVTSPKTALNEWHLEQNDETTRIRLQLNQPITRASDLRLEISARAESGNAVLPATARQLQVIHFLEANTRRELLQLRNRKSQQIRLADHIEKARLLPEQLSAEDSDLFLKLPSGTLLDASQLEPAQVIQLPQQAIEYTAEVQINLEATASSAHYSFRIDGHPLSGAIDQVVVELSEPLPDSVQWELAGQRRDVIATRIDVHPNDSTAKYLLQLPVAMLDDFRLQATHSRPINQANEQCILVNLPLANYWTGEFQLHGPLQGLRVLDKDWPSKLLASSEQRESQLPLLGAYPFDAADFYVQKKLHIQVLQKTSDSIAELAAAPPLIAWLAEYRTLQAADGDALYVASYSLENIEAGEAQITLPNGAELQEAWLDGYLLEPQQVASGSNAYRFRFGYEQRWPHLILKYSTRMSPLGRAASIQPNLPQCSFPIHLNRWTLWAPEQYEIDNTQQNYTSQRYHWWRRIFGPLARLRGETVFNPFRNNQWSQLWFAPLEGQKTRFAAANLARRLVDRLETNGNLAWGALLQELVESERLARILYIDRAALLAKGIQASARPELGEVGHAIQATATPLSRYGLALLVNPDMVVFTTTERVAQWHDQLRTTDFSGVFVVSSDDLIDSLEIARRKITSDILTVERWQNSPAQPESLWIGRAVELTDVGRRAQTIEFIETLPKLTVRRAYVQRALWYALLLLTIVLGVWQLAHFPNAMILIAATAGAACLVVPIPWLTAPQAVFLGLVAAAIIRIALKTSQLGKEQLAALRKPVQAAGVLLVSSLWIQSTLAQPTEVAKKQELPRVLVPINSQGEQQGEDVFLSAKLLEKLQPSAQSSGYAGAEVTILAASYRGRVSNDFRDASTGDNSLLADPWTLRWKIKTYVPNCRLFLPLVRNEAVWQQQSHRLNGLPVKVNWQVDGQGCSVLLPETGVHWLQLVAQPRVRTNDRTSGIRLHVPPLSGAQLDLSEDADIDNLRITGGSLATDFNADQQQYLLEARDTIRLRWTAQALKNSASPWERVEQRSWLRVNPAASQLDVQLAVTGLQATAPTLTLDVSPQLKLAPLESDSPVIEVLAPAPNRPYQLRLKLREDLPENLIIPLRFNLQRAVSVGHLFFPRVRLLGNPPALNLFAVSVSPELIYDESTTNNARRIEPSEFIAAWNGKAKEPHIAYALDSEDLPWSLRVWPSELSFFAQQSLRVDCSLNRTQVHFEAVARELNRALLFHRIQVPESLQVDTVTVQILAAQATAFLTEEQPTAVPLRWYRVNPTEVVVFLGQPLREMHKLELRGYLRTDANREITLPRIQLVDGKQGEIYLDLYRDEQVQVRWVDTDQQPKLLSQQTSSRQKESVHLGRYILLASENKPLSKLQIERNRQQFVSTSVASVDYDAEAGWSATLNSQLRIQRGVLNRLSLVVPSNFRAPYVLSSDLQGDPIGWLGDEVRETSTGKEITLFLAKPLVENEELKVQVTGNLSLPADGRLKIPRLQWKNAAQSNRFLILPTTAAGQILDWITEGLRPQTLPLELQDTVTDENALSYHIEQNQFLAEERSLRGVLRNARVRYVNVTASLGHQGLLIATAEIILQAGGASSCQIQLPPNSELSQLVVGDQTIRRERLEDGTWRVLLGPAFLPQRILVSYRSQHDRSHGYLQLVAPQVAVNNQMLSMPPAWWRIRPTYGLRLWQPEVGQTVDVVQYRQRNQKLSYSVLKDALSQALELPRSEGQAWFHTWHHITEQATQQLQAFNAGDDVDLEAAKMARQKLAEELALNNPEIKGAKRLIYPIQVVPSPRATAESQYAFYRSDAQGQLVLPMSSGPPSNLWRWFAAAALLCGTLAVVLQLKNNYQWHHQLCRWPHGIAVIGGMAWWLLLRPSALGLLIIALALISMTIKRWHRIQQRRQSGRTSDAQFAI